MKDTNTGNRNTGNCNTGDRNTGYRNTGDWNTGNWNTGDWNTGLFNTDEPNARLFNKESNIKMSDLINSEAYPDFSDFQLCWWIEEKNMTDEEKEEHKTYKTTGGFLKSVDYKTAWSVFWRITSEDNIKKILNLPNFDWKIFTEITGIEQEPSLKGKEVEVKLDGVTYKAIIQ